MSCQCHKVGFEPWFFLSPCFQVHKPPHLAWLHATRGEPSWSPNVPRISPQHRRNINLAAQPPSGRTRSDEPNSCHLSSTGQPLATDNFSSRFPARALEPCYLGISMHNQPPRPVPKHNRIDQLSRIPARTIKTFYLGTNKRKPPSGPGRNAPTWDQELSTDHQLLTTAVAHVAPAPEGSVNFFNLSNALKRTQTRRNPRNGHCRSAIAKGTHESQNSRQRLDCKPPEAQN